MNNQTMLNARLSNINASGKGMMNGALKSLKKYGPGLFQVALVFGTRAVFAQDTGSVDDIGGGICKVVNLLMGKWVFGSAMAAMLASGAALLFGAELTDLVKKAVTIVAGVGFLVSFGGLLALAYAKLGSAAC